MIIIPDLDKNSERFIWPSNKQPPLLNSIMYDRLYNLIKNNIHSINKDFIEDIKINGAYVNVFDQIIIQCLINQFKVKEATEIGLGSTTTNMTSMGVKVTSFALEDIRKDNRENFTHVNRNLKEPEVKEMFKKSLDSSTFLLIDGNHSYNFADCYKELVEYSNVSCIFIHDHYNPLRPMVDGEQWLVDNTIVGDKYEVLFYSDLLGYCSEEEQKAIFELVGFDFSYQVLKDGEWNLPGQGSLDGAAMLNRPQLYNRGWCPICCIVLVPKGFKL